LKERLSYSELSTYLVCQRHWYIEYVQRERLPSGRMFLGSLVHELLAMHYSGHTVKVGSAQELAAKLLEDKEWEDVHMDVPHIITHANTLMMKYLDFYRDEDLDVVAVEQRIEKPPLVGVVDLQYKDKKGNVWLMEHKTKARFLTQPYDWQIHCYSFLVPEAVGVVYNQLKTYEYKKPPAPGQYFERVPLFVGEGAQDKLLGLVNDVISEMNEIIKGKRTPRETFVGYICSMCSAKGSCPAFIE
jgi:hypothetical protein